MFIGSIDHALADLTQLKLKPGSLEARHSVSQIKFLRSLRDEGFLVETIKDEPFSRLLGLGGEIAFPFVGLRFRGHLSKTGRRSIRISDYEGERRATYSFSKAGLSRAVNLAQAQANRQVREIVESWEPARLPLTDLRNSQAEAARNRSNLGRTVAKTRLAKGWSRAGLAKKIEVSASWLARLEAGKELPTNFRLALIARLLGVRPFDLLYSTSPGKFCSRPAKG